MLDLVIVYNVFFWVSGRYHVTTGLSYYLLKSTGSLRVLVCSNTESQTDLLHIPPISRPLFVVQVLLDYSCGIGYPHNTASIIIAHSIALQLLLQQKYYFPQLSCAVSIVLIVTLETYTKKSKVRITVRSFINFIYLRNKSIVKHYF